MGHEDAFPPPRLSARYRFSQRTFAGTRRNGRDAPTAAIRLSTRCPPFDDAESRLTTDKRHVVGNYRLGESLQRERANLFGCDTSFLVRR